jgi:hypothetical protein
MKCRPLTEKTSFLPESVKVKFFIKRIFLKQYSSTAIRCRTDLQVPKAAANLPVTKFFGQEEWAETKGRLWRTVWSAEMLKTADE